MTLKFSPDSQGRGGIKNNIAAYIEDLVRELEQLAAREGIETLRDLLRQAREEARRAALSD